MEKSSPTARTAPEAHKFSYSGPKDAPIRSVVVFSSKNKAEITRVLHFASATTVGLHEVHLTDPTLFCDPLCYAQLDCTPDIIGCL